MSSDTRRSGGSGVKRSAERRMAGSIATPRPCSVTSTGRSTAASAVLARGRGRLLRDRRRLGPDGHHDRLLGHLGDPVAQGEAVDAEAALAGHDHDVVVGDAQAGGDRRVVNVAGDALDQRVDPGLADREPDRDLAGRRDAEPGQDLPPQPARLEGLVHRPLHLGPRAEAPPGHLDRAVRRVVAHDHDRLGHELLGPVADGALDLVRVEPADLDPLDLDRGRRGVVVAGRAERRAHPEHDGQQPEQAAATTRPAGPNGRRPRARRGGRGGGRRPRVGGRLRVASRMRRRC